MSHYADYMKEAFGEHVVEDENGFYHYSFYDDYLFINNLYVSPSSRGFKVAKGYIRQMAKIAEIKKYKQLIGSVSLSNLKKESVLTTYLRNKCKISSSNENFIYVSIKTEDALTL